MVSQLIGKNSPCLVTSASVPIGLAQGYIVTLFPSSEHPHSIGMGVGPQGQNGEDSDGRGPERPVKQGAEPRLDPHRPLHSPEQRPVQSVMGVESVALWFLCRPPQPYLGVRFRGALGKGLCPREFGLGI